MNLNASPLPSIAQEESILGMSLPERYENSNFLQYGALKIAADYCNLAGFLPCLRGEWQHGWHPPEHNVHPELVVGTNGKSRINRRRRCYLVAREDQKTYLASQGYSQVYAVGAPIIYVKKPRIDRIPGSLLVMPSHSLATTTHSWNFDEYADQIKNIESNFSQVVVCVHPNCWEKNYWIREFTRRGIPCVSGATLFDVNALHRMAMLFSRFEFITSNQIGSQHFYAPLFGAKPSIYGTYAEWAYNDFKNSLLFSKCPELIDVCMQINREVKLRKKYAGLFCIPYNAGEFLAEARFQLGYSNRINSEALRMALGWNNQHVYFHRLKHKLGLVKKTIHCPPRTERDLF
jgi:hypothetical protein